MASSRSLAAYVSPTWVIDSGAIDHVTGIHSQFQSYSSTNDQRVRIADGSYNHIAGKGTVCIFPNLSLSSVLHVPSFSFNLLFVSALTKHLHCCASFYPYFVFQDLRTGRKIGGGNESNGLYTLDLENTESKVLQTEVDDDN